MNSELRFNALRGEWVLFSPKRQGAKRPHDIFEKKRPVSPKSKCPFENLEKSGNLPPYFQFPESGSWKTAVMPNKFPGLDTSPKEHILHSEKFHMTIGGYGYHDLLITKDHETRFSELTEGEIFDVFQALRKRYLQVSGDPKIDYISMFQNWGPSVGASLYHPHMQIIALPVVPSHISHELVYSLRCYEKHKSCLYCDIIKSERKGKKRIVFENKHVVAFVPYAAQEPYEVLLFPKEHEVFFETASDAVLKDMAIAFKKVLKSIQKKLSDPDYNMYIHTAPATDGGEYPYHHWYIRILPKSNIDAGFELGTGVQINTVFPEDAAKLLRLQG